MDQKEQTECMGLGLDGMQKMNGAINVDFMTAEEIHQKLEVGYKDMESGKVRKVPAGAFRYWNFMVLWTLTPQQVR